MLNKVLIDVERLKYKHTGLYHFCFHLSNALIKNFSKDREELFFFLPPTYKSIFGNQAGYIKQYDFHKFFLPSTSAFKVWHSIHQDSSYYPSNKKIKKVLTIHDINFMYDESKSENKKNNYLKKLKKRIESADYIVAISKYTLKDVSTYIDLSKKPTMVIYNGCNIISLDVVQKPIIIPKQSFLFTIGVIMAKKNFHVLPALLKNNNMQLIIAGIIVDKAYQQKIVSEARKHGVAERVVFTGPISENDKQWYLQHCTAFVFPSISEGFGLPVIEAMYFGKPVLLSQCTSLPEIGGDCAYYFSNFEPEHMQEVLEKSLHHYETIKPIDKIKQRATLFSWNEAATQYLEVYRKFYD